MGQGGDADSFRHPAEDGIEALGLGDGAVRVRHVRIPGLASLGALVRICPGRLADRVGTPCSEATAWDAPEALILNDSEVIQPP